MNSPELSPRPNFLAPAAPLWLVPLSFLFSPPKLNMSQSLLGVSCC